MKNIKIKPATLARIGALLVALINQCLAVFGKGNLPFTENMAYQVITLACTFIAAAVNCWYNQDITKIARLSGKIFDALKDGKLVEDELDELVRYAEAEEAVGEAGNSDFLIGFANGIIANIQAKK